MPEAHVNRIVTFALAVFCVGSAVALSQAQTPAALPAAASKILAEGPLGEIADPKGRMSVLTLAPGWWGAGREGVGAHQHPGAIFAYILKGAVESQVDPDPPKIYRAGEVFYEPAMHAHRLFRNVSKTEPAELLMFQVFDKDAPTATAVK
jgi:quercetin dioxygenase-like cupin family protein